MEARPGHFVALVALPPQVDSRTFDRVGVTPSSIADPDVLLERVEDDLQLGFFMGMKLLE